MIDFAPSMIAPSLNAGAVDAITTSWAALAASHKPILRAITIRSRKINILISLLSRQCFGMAWMASVWHGTRLGYHPDTAQPNRSSHLYHSYRFYLQKSMFCTGWM